MSKLAYHTRDALLGLLVTVVLLAIVETGMRAFAGGDGADPLRGFDAGRDYLAAVQDPPGAWRTTFLRAGVEPVVVPPKQGRTSVLLFGGSNTRGFPQRVLEGRLVELSGHPFLVRNLGAPGYGSERVSLIFGQALQRLDPDVVVIYAGHNEFVEKSFKLDLDAGPAWARALDSAASKSRLVHLFSGYFEAPREASDRDWEWEYSKFSDLHYDETLGIFELYRRNIEWMCDAALARDVRVVLCTLVFNDLAAPFVSNLPPSVTPDDAARFEDLRAEARAALPAYLGELLPEREQDRAHGWDWLGSKGTREGDWDRSRGDLGRRACLGVLADEDPQFPGPRRWTDTAWELVTALDRLWARDPGDRSHEELERALASYDQALGLVPDHPRALFERGLLQWLLGDAGAASRDFQAAARYDRAPRKANGVVNDILREIAAERPEVLLVDAERLFRERMPDGIVGWEWMIDHCHLSKGAARVFMGDLAQTVLERWPSWPAH